MTPSRLLATALLVAVALAPLTAFTPLVAQAGAPKAAGPVGEPDVLALVFTAEWCAACKVLDPKLRAARTSLDEEAVRFVILDQTNADARREATASAREGGFADVYAAHEGKTGFVLLLDADSKEILDRITSSDSEAQIRQKVRRAIAAA